MLIYMDVLISRMKTDAALLFLCTVAFAVFAGCTAQQPAPPTPTPAPATTILTTATTIAPSDIVGTWTVTTMAIQNGRAVQTPTVQMTATFLSNGTVMGYSGCNNYAAAYTLTGATTPKGKGISTGPVTASQRFCSTVADQETAYLAILQGAVAYNVNIDKLTITANDGTAIVYQKM